MRKRRGADGAASTAEECVAAPSVSLPPPSQQKRGQNSQSGSADTTLSDAMPLCVCIRHLFDVRRSSRHLNRSVKRSREEDIQYPFDIRQRSREEDIQYLLDIRRSSGDEPPLDSDRWSTLADVGEEDEDGGSLARIVEEVEAEGIPELQEKVIALCQLFRLNFSCINI